ncbi:MAG: Ig-like domain-containing protein, partial [Methylovulum sp.]|nr:Ig-like domain-containing protein [Methylovulum sp.]
TATVTFSFSEAPTGFSASDVSATGGTVSAPTVTADSKVYTATFTPTANTNALTGAISVAANSYTDTIGNQGAASNTLSLTGDTLAPTLAITSSLSNLTAGQTAAITFNFSEAPTGFEAGDVTVTGGSLGALSGTGLTRTATFTPTDNASGIASISVANGSYTDAVGNIGGAGVTPSVSFNTIVSDPTPPPSGPTSQSLDALTSSQQTPAVFNAGTGAFALTDIIATTSFVHVSNFGADDAIAISGGGSNHLIVANDGADVLFTVNNNGTVSQITLVGVASASDIIGDLSAFNALSVGNLTYS